MKKRSLFFYYMGLVLLLTTLSSQLSQAQQTNYWQQKTDYNIRVLLDDSAKTLTGFLSLQYTNASPDTLRFIWFHVWPNAFKNDRTAYAAQTLKNGSTQFYFSNDDERGYLNRLQFEVDGTQASIEAHPIHQDIVQLILPKPLLPQQSITITTPFFVKLPYLFSRGGFNKNDFYVTQWYPKPAVYDHLGWHEMPYLDQGEFYSEFGNFEVEIVVPQEYKIAATGVLQNEDILEQYKKLGKTPLEQQPTYLSKLVVKPSPTKTFKTTPTNSQQAAKTTVGTSTKNKPANHNNLPKATPSKLAKHLIAYRFKQENCHDFAWFASKEFLILYDTAQLMNKVVDVFSFFKKEDIKKWKPSILYAKKGLHAYSNWIGNYPYSTATLVAGPDNDFSGGMEYPSITLVTTQGGDAELEETIVHELGHNWFYAALASNERKHAWMDEGMNSYYQKRYAATYMQKPAIKSKFINNRIPASEDELLISTVEKIQKIQPIDLPAADYTDLNYYVSVYAKGSLWMQQLEKKLGTKVFDSCMQLYYTTWYNKHPYPANFKQIVEQVSKMNVDSVFAALQSTVSPVQHHSPKKIKPIGFFSLKETQTNNYIGIMPVLSYNYYDKLGIGLAVHNYQLPLNRFQFYVAPLYALESKQFNYAARFSYHTFKKQSWLEYSLGTQQYTMNNFTPVNKATIQQQMQRFTPAVQYTLYNKDATSKQKWQFLVKSFLLRENGLAFSTITTPSGTEDVVNKTTQSSYINRISITTQDSRVLYPYSFNVTIDQGDNFIRAGFTGKYFFNYKNRKGGIDARVFAGKFIYTTEKTFIKQYETDRYHLNMTGARGYEDYTYSGYFVGRNEFEGWTSQQIMERDGFFKVRTDLLSNKVGKTDDWLMAINLSGEIPEAINIFSALPIKIPIKFFVDFGTYAEAWKENPATGRFLYDFGLQLPIAKGLINVYVPLLYSKVYGDYFKSTLGDKRFWKTISFSVDLQVLQLNKLSQYIPL